MSQGLNRLLLSAATVSVVVTLAAPAASLWWVADLFAQFRMQYLFGQLLLIVALLTIRRRAWAAALLPCVVMNGYAVRPYLLPNTASASGVTTLKLMTVNVESRNDNYSDLLAIIASEQPDIVLVLEYSPRWAGALASLERQYPYDLQVPREGAFGIALWSRYPLVRAREFALGPTTALTATVSAPAGSFDLYGVHLLPPLSANWSALRNKQLIELAGLSGMRRAPLLLAGDFNISPYSPLFTAWLTAANLRDTQAGRGPSLSWPTFLPLLGIPIDHCIVSEEFSVTNHRRLPSFGSDHYPIVVELSQEMSL